MVRARRRAAVNPVGEILFLPRHNERAERYSGKRTSAEDADAHTVTGFEKVLPIEKLESELDLALSSHARLYAPWSESYAGQLRSRYPFRDVADATPLIAKLRVKKSEAEIAAIQHATDVSMEAHRAAWKRLAAGQYEYQVAAALLDTFLDAGCEGPAYSPIVGSGPERRHPALHVEPAAHGSRRAGGRSMRPRNATSYASDITRTVPVGGKFTPRQREIYQIVLGAQKAAIAAVKPGAWLIRPRANRSPKSPATTWTRMEKTCMASRWANILLTTSGIRWVWKCTTRRSDGPLEAGMVITIEPGVYIAEEKLGIRIEDVVLVTPNGAKVLSAALPKEPDEIEKAVSK